MDYLGYKQIPSYMTGSNMGYAGQPNYLPSIANQSSSYKPYDSYPAPTPLRRSLTTLPWRPTTYYNPARNEPGVPLSQSMPGPASSRNQLTQLDPVKVPPVFTATRNALYTRFTPNDWSASNAANYQTSNIVRSAGLQVRLDTDRLVRQVDDRTRATQADVGQRLGQRVGDIHFWQTEVNNETATMKAEIDALVRSKAVLERTLAETEKPLSVANECLYNREKRQNIDLVHDNVEKQLIQEVDTIKNFQEQMRRLNQDTANQISMCRAAQHELEKDSRDKGGALNLDSTCHQLRNSSRGISFHDGVERVDNAISIPRSWAQFSSDNIQRSKSERGASVNTRNHIEALLNRATNAHVNQWNTVNNAFNDRIRETNTAKHNLQAHLSRVLQEIFDMEKNIELLKKCIHDKENPMAVAQTRLATRTRRPNVEACRDPVHHRLVEEVHEINDTVFSLKAKLREAENALQHLLRTKHSLEQDLSIKSNSLSIDAENCMGMRQTFPMATRVPSY